jgi:hypothetical protein
VSLKPKRYSTELIEEAQNAFSKDFGHEISKEKSEEMLSDLTGFFALLQEWDLKDKEQSQPSKGAISNERVN